MAVSLRLIPAHAGKTQGLRLALGGDRGLIPAHAGKTVWSMVSVGMGWAHPRSRGENAIQAFIGFFERGSSPLTRGKLVSRTQVGDVVGLIPAHAGKTHELSKQSHKRGAHPRSRGENQGVGRELGKVEGSSPLTRGKRVSERPIFEATGLIPAHAGKT